jgi:hypothetical protein
MDAIPWSRAKEVPMTRIVLDLDSSCPPSRAVDALIDFSERRPDLWPGLAREFYEVAWVGETSAEVREGSTKPIKVWAREHYDWSTPGTVRWSVLESNFCTPGSGVAVTVTDGSNGGSHLHLEWERHPSNLRGRVAIVFMRLMGRQLLRKYIGDVLTRLARDAAGSSGTGSHVP